MLYPWLLRRFATLCPLLLCIPFFAACRVALPPENVVDLRLQYCEKGLATAPQDRRQCLEDWLLENPSDPIADDIRYSLANEWAAVGNPARARELVDDILRHEPGNALARILKERIARLRQPVLRKTRPTPGQPAKAPPKIPEPSLRLQIGTRVGLSIRLLKGKLAWTGADDKEILAPGLHVIRAPGLMKCLDQCLWQRGNDLFRYGAEWDGTQWFTTLPIEEYLQGVVGSEMATGWPLEALKAQAVVSRTYAWAYYADVSHPVVLQPTTYHQVYRGTPPATDIRRAVEATQGQVLTWQGSPIVAYFHADNGGFSEQPHYVWGDALSYFKLVTDSFSDQVPHWEWMISKSEFKRLLRRKFLRKGENIRKVRLKRHHRRRVFKVIVETDRRNVEISGNDFRLQMGPRRLKSLWFQIFVEGKNYRFSGRGYGHGVGLSQWGARRRAEAGQKYRKILQHYYFGVKQEQLW